MSMEIERVRYRYNQRPQRRFSRRIVPGLIAVMFAAIVSGYATLALTKPVPAVAAESVEIESVSNGPLAEITWPAEGQAAVGSMADGVLMTSPGEQQKPMASITKLVTALAVLDKLALEPGQSGPTFTVMQQDIDYYHAYVSKFGSVMPVNLGQTITERDALTGMLLPSANNIADSLVRWVFGSNADYINYANNMLERYGLEQTVVNDASGFSPGSKSSPSDLIKLGQIVLRQPVLEQIVSMQSADIPGSGPVKNTNMLLGDPEAVGIKTGNTDEAGSCLLFAYRFGPENQHIFIGSVMGQPNYYGMFSTARSLKDSALEQFSMIEVLPAGTVVGRLNSAWGKSAEVVTSEPIKTFGWPGKSYPVEVVIDQSDLPVLNNQVVGRVTLVSNPEVAVSAITQSPLSGPGTIWRLANYW